MSIQANASKKSADIARRGVAVTQDTFRLIERPALGVEASATLTKLVAGEEIEGVIQFKNSGHTPARNTSVHTLFSTEKARDIKFPCPEPSLSFDAELASKTTIPIGGAKLTHPRTFIKANEVDIKRIESGEWWLYVYAIIRYEGPVGQKYFTEYYARYSPKLKLFVECGSHNEAN